MSHHKRRKPRRKVRCQLCTPGRKGNSLKEAPRRVLIARGAYEASYVLDEPAIDLGPLAFRHPPKEE